MGKALFGNLSSSVLRGYFVLNEKLLLVFTLNAQRVWLAAERERAAVTGLRRFHFLVPIRLLPDADEPSQDGCRARHDKYDHCNHT